MGSGRRRERSTDSYVHFSRQALSDRKGSGWPGGVAPLRMLNRALVLLTEPRVRGMLKNGDMFAVLNHPWLGQCLKLGKERNPATTMIIPLFFLV